MTANMTTAGSLSVGDTVIGNDGFALRVTAIVRKPGSRILLVTVETVEAGSMICRPEPTTFRVSVNSMVSVPA